MDGSVSVRQLLSFYETSQPGLSKSTLYWYVGELTRMGILERSGQGLYRLPAENETVKPQYHAATSVRLVEYAAMIHKDLPFLDICVWETRQYHEFMLHQPIRSVLFIETSRDSMTSLFDLLLSKGLRAFLNPDVESMDRYVWSGDAELVVRPFLTDAPVKLLGGGSIPRCHVPKLEKLLVELILDSTLYPFQGAEQDRILVEALGSYQVSATTIRRYATRRKSLVRVREAFQHAGIEGVLP